MLNDHHRIIMIIKDPISVELCVYKKYKLKSHKLYLYYLYFHEH